MAVQAKDIPTEQGIFNECWALFKKYYDEPNTDETWQNFLAEANKCCEKYDNNMLATKMMLAIIETKESMC